VDNRPVPIVASGWSAEYNGTQLTANSTPVTIYYDVSYEDSVFGMAIEDISPGTARLTLEPKNSSAHLRRFDTSRFDRFVLGFNLSASPPQFQSSGVYRQESAAGSIVVSFQQPGVYYYGATPSYQGRVGGSSAGGVYDGRPSLHPTALVLAGPDGGTNNQTIPADFAGAVHHLKPLPTPRQFCIFEKNLTVFSGSQLRIPLCRPDPAMEIPHQPAFTSVVAPSWLRLRGRNNQTCRTCSGPAYVSWLNDTVQLADGRTRYTFQSPIARWSIYNSFVPLFVTFDESHATSLSGATAAAAVSLSVLIHADANDAATVPLSSWQTLSALCVATPQLPIPKRLITSITWSDEDIFLDEADQPEDGPQSFVAMYKRLGFNTVPKKSMPRYFESWAGRAVSNNSVVPTAGAAKFPHLFAAGRTAPVWDGMLYGPECSGPVPSTGVILCKGAPNASKLPPGLSAAQTKTELQKWQNAHDFYTQTKHLDVAYDGIFSVRAATQFCELAKATASDWVFMDDEAFGEGFGTWRYEVALSANAAARAVPHEKPTDLAWRMAAEMMAAWTACVAASSPKTTVAWYGGGFPDPVYSAAGISAQPSEYGPMHYLSSFASSVRSAKQHQGKMGQGKPRHLLPWLTSGTYGQMSALLTWEGALHAFGGGATGWSFFFTDNFDDPGKILALSTATALAVPFEDELIHGTPLISTAVQVVEGLLRAWSGVQLPTTTSSHWLVLTPGKEGRTQPSNVTITLTLPDGGDDNANEDGGLKYIACDLTTGHSYHTTAAKSGRLGIKAALQRTTVVHVSAAAACDETKKLPADAWLPVGGYN
jgi:hypothetical protein